MLSLIHIDDSNIVIVNANDPKSVFDNAVNWEISPADVQNTHAYECALYHLKYLIWN